MAPLGRQMGIWAPFLSPGCLLWNPFGGLLGSFGVLWVLFWGPLGLLWAPFGSILDTQGQLSRPSVAFWRPFAHLNVFFEASAAPLDFCLPFGIEFHS